MRALLERSRSARCLAVLAAVCAVLPLAHAASAQELFGFRLDTLWPELHPTPAAVAPAPAPHRHARRIWAASWSRPLRITLAHRGHDSRLAGRAHRAVQVARAPEPQVIFPKLVVLPKPPRPALVSIYQDRTLRSGDAVMMADGVHVFRDVGVWPHRPQDFVRLPLVTAMGWHLRQTLDAFDKNPPTRWTSVDTTAG